MTKIASILAVASIAAAANNSTLTINTPDAASGCSFKDFTATDSAGVASVNACPTPVGNVAIAGQGIGMVDLSNVKKYYGDLKMNGTDVTSFNAPNLQLVSGLLQLTNNHILLTLNLAQLSTINSLTFTALPKLTKTGLTTGLTTAQSIVISDTGLKSLEGINVYSLKVFNVNNNRDITLIDSGLEQVTESLTITDNEEAVVSMKKLTAVKDLYLGKVSNFTFGNLTHINGSVAISESYMDVIDLSQIESIGNSLTIYSNNNLTKLNVSSVESIGGALQISDNAKLGSFKGSFANLQSVGGSITINGTFNNGSFESLETVAGGFSLLSKDGELSCDEISKLNKNVKGDHFVCSGAGTASVSSTGVARPTGGSSSGSSSSKNNSSSSSSKKSDAAVIASRANGVFALVLAALTTALLTL